MAKKSNTTAKICFLCGIGLGFGMCAYWVQRIDKQNPIPPEAQCGPNKTETSEVLCPRYFLKKNDKN